MKSHRSAIQTTLLLTLTTLTLACGYGSQSMPPAPGTMPAIAALAPSQATSGGPAFTLTVKGSNFNTNAVVNWNLVAQTGNTHYVSSNQLTADIPASAIATAGTVEVSVTNPGSSGTGPYGNGGTMAATSAIVDFTIQ
jgi:hypothetical protein